MKIPPNRSQIDQLRHPTYDDIFAAANSNWQAILAGAGIVVNDSKKGSPCPSCGGRDRFTFIDTSGDGTFYCRGGAGGSEHTGNGLTLLKLCKGWSTAEALRYMVSYLGITSASPPPQRKLRPNRLTVPSEISQPDELNDSQQRMKRYAQKLWFSAKDADDYVASHPYAKDKGIDWAAGARRGRATGKVIGRNADCVIVPIRTISEFKFQAVQCINSDGKKQTFGPIKGCGLLLGNLEGVAGVAVVEGWADCVSVVFHEFDGDASCIAAFGSSNMLTVADLMAQRFPAKRITILRDAV